MWGLYDFLSRALLPHHRRYVVLCSKTTPSRESRQFDAHPCDGAYPVAGEIHRLPTPPSHQRQTTESRAGSDSAGPADRSHLPEEVVLQETLPFFDGDRFNGNGGTRFVGSRFAVHAIDLCLIVHS